MSLADELLKLQQLRDSGTLTADEFELAKDRLLQAPPAVAPPSAAPAPAPVVYSLLKEVDPAVTRVADKAVNFNGVSTIIFGVAFLIVLSIIGFAACSMSDGGGPGRDTNQHSPLGDLCNQPGVTCR